MTDQPTITIVDSHDHEVRGERARLYVHDQEPPTLIVNEVQSGAQGKGAVACGPGQAPSPTSAISQCPAPGGSRITSAGGA